MGLFSNKSNGSKRREDNQRCYSLSEISALLSAIYRGNTPKNGMEYPPHVRSALRAAGYNRRVVLSPNIIVSIRWDGSNSDEQLKGFITEAITILANANEAVLALAKQYFGNNALTEEEIQTMVDAAESAAKAAAPGATPTPAAT